MSSTIWIFQILPIVLSIVVICRGQINTTDYKRMPVLYKYDNYYECINRETAESKYPAKYCMVFVEIQPNKDSTMWQHIEITNADKFNYRHDILYRGVCLERCNDLLYNNRSNKTFESGLLNNEKTQMFQTFYNTTLDRMVRRVYQPEIHECVNREYVQAYNLSTKTFINYCIDPEQTREKDIYYTLTILLIICFILLNILSSTYDARLKSQQVTADDKDNYYNVRRNNQVQRYLTAFSVYRNYKRLVAANKSDIGSDLAFLDGFRAILCFLIICEHVFLVQFIHVGNSEFIENLWHQFVSRLLIHLLIWLELFFTLSGLLLYIKFDKSQYITPKSSFLHSLQVFVRLLFSRYLRYLPSLLFLIIFAANITYYHGNATLGRSFMDPNCLACRSSWWQNILMINNYYMKISCLMHTWYIAADFQLYAFFLIILIVMAKYPKFKTLILMGVAILAAGINFGVNYALKLDSTFLPLPESLRLGYFRNFESAKHMYHSSYTNINSFLLGITAGFIYMKYLRKNPGNKKLLGKILQNSSYFGWICILGILCVGTTIIDHTETTIWTAAYCLLHRHLGLAIVMVVVILRGMCNGGGFLKFSFFRVLSRISFQVYLWQIIVLLNMLPYLNEPLNLNYATLCVLGLFLYVTTSLIAFVVVLFVEYPIAEVVNVIDIEKKI